MTKSESFGDLDDFFASFNEKSGAKRLEINTQRNPRIDALLRTPQATFRFECEENMKYPGGVEAFEMKYRPILEVALQRFTTHFPIGEKEIRVVWKTPNATDSTSFRLGATTFDLAVGANTNTESRQTELAVSHSEFEELVIVGDSKDISFIEEAAVHELGHIAFGQAVPTDVMIQELPSCFAAQLLSPHRSEAVHSFRNPHNFKAPEVILGNEGWGLPPFARIIATSSAPMYTAWLRGWEEVFGSTAAIEKALTKSLEIAQETPSFLGNDGRKHRRVPTREEWLKAMDDIIPGFIERFKSSKSLSSPMHEALRLTWSPHQKWGGTIALTKCTKNNRFSVNAGNLDLCFGSMSAVQVAAEMCIPKFNLTFGITGTPQALIEPKSINDAALELCNSTLTKGDKIFITFKVYGSNKQIELVWDEDAESMKNYIGNQL